MEINKLALRNFYENNKDDYTTRRSKGDNLAWDESYKWKFLGEANAALAAYEHIDKDNIKDIVAILNKYKSNFAHWIDMDDLNLLVEKSNGYQIIREIWRKKIDSIDSAIDSANNMSSFMLDKKFSPSTFGYILAAQDCDRYIIYRDSLYKSVAELCHIDKPGTLTQGQKYKLLNDCTCYVGELMKTDESSYKGLAWHTALNGQDFLYATIQYELDSR